MKHIFIEELMRRYMISSSYEMSNGTIVPMMVYMESDPVVAWKNEQHDSNIAGKKWKAEYDAEYLRFAMKGLGRNKIYLLIFVRKVIVQCYNQLQSTFILIYLRRFFTEELSRVFI